MDFEENKSQQAASSNDISQNADPLNDDENMSEQSFAELLDASFDYAPPRRGEIRQAVILQIEPNEIIVELGAKKDGIVTAQDLERLDDEFRRSLHVGQEVPVYVLNPRDTDGNLVVSINMGLQYDWDKARTAEADEVVEVTVTGHNRGGCWYAGTCSRASSPRHIWPPSCRAARQRTARGPERTRRGKAGRQGYRGIRPADA